MIVAKDVRHIRRSSILGNREYDQLECGRRTIQQRWRQRWTRKGFACCRVLAFVYDRLWPNISHVSTWRNICNVNVYKYLYMRKGKEDICVFHLGFLSFLVVSLFHIILVWYITYSSSSSTPFNAPCHAKQHHSTTMIATTFQVS